MTKEAKFVLIASVALLTSMLLPLTEVYWYCAVLNCEGEREVKPLLDKYYVRCRPEVIQAMYETEDDRKNGPFWGNHFTRDKDGKSQRTIAEFDSLPDPEAMNALLSVWTSPDAVNNVAAMYYNK